MPTVQSSNKYATPWVQTLHVDAALWADSGARTRYDVIRLSKGRTIRRKDGQLLHVRIKDHGSGSNCGQWSPKL